MLKTIINVTHVQHSTKASHHFASFFETHRTLRLPLQTPSLLPGAVVDNFNVQPLGRLGNHLLAAREQDLGLALLNLVKRAAPLAQEPREQLLGDLVVLDVAALDALLERRQDVLARKRLREDARRRVALALFGADVVGCIKPSACCSPPFFLLGQKEVLTRAVGAEEELAAAGHQGLQQGPAVLGRLGHGLAEAKDVADGVVDDQAQVVRRDGAGHRVAALADGLDRVGRGDVLEHDAQAREASVDVEQRREELALGVEHADVLGRVRGDLAVDVEDHVDLFESVSQKQEGHKKQGLYLLHGRKGREKGVVGDDAAGRVCRGALRVRLDTGDAGLLGGADDVRRDTLVEEERHEVLDAGVDGLQALAIGQGRVHRGDGRHEVGHAHDAVAAAGADRGSDDLADVAVAEVDVASGDMVSEIEREAGGGGGAGSLTRHSPRGAGTGPSW